jgi:hypothetical protein
MKAPKLTAFLACSVLLFLLVQCWAWHWRPEPGWHPQWWQSHSLAMTGFFLSMPAMIPALILQNLGVTSELAGWVAVRFGFIVEFVLTYLLFYFLAKFSFRAVYDHRVHKATA